MAPEHWPLLAHFPALAGTLSPTALCNLPTAVDALPALSPRAWVKRDDQSAPGYGGNKMRKLEFVLPEISRQGAHTVVTLGATGTNAGVAAALACQRIGVGCEIHTFPQPETATVAENRQRMHDSGARFRHHRSLLGAALGWYLHPGRVLPGYYFLYAGCSNPVATFAYVNAMAELRAQVDAGQCPKPDHVVVAAGSGATVAGLVLGAQLFLPGCRVHAVRVAPSKLGPFNVCNEAVVRGMIRTAARTLAVTPAAGPEDPLVWHDRYYGDGYGVSDPAVVSALAVAADNGLTLEATYTGKAFACFQDLLQGDNGNILFWHTFNSQPRQ